MSERPEVIAAILECLAQQDGQTWYQIDKNLSNSGIVPPGPYTVELSHLEQFGRLRRDGHRYWLTAGSATQS